MATSELKLDALPLSFFNFVILWLIEVLEFETALDGWRVSFSILNLIRFGTA